MAKTVFGYGSNVTETYDHVAKGGTDSLGWTVQQPARPLSGDSSAPRRQGTALDTNGTPYDEGLGASIGRTNSPTV